MAYASLAPNRQGETLGLYAIGYFEAARVLFRHGNEGRGLVDLFFYPAAMSLRHGMELLAKQCCIYVAYELRDPSLLYVPTHAIKDEWLRGGQLAKEIVGEDYSAEERRELLEAFPFLDNLVEDLHGLDPDGMLFRYPETVERRWKQKTLTRGERREDTHVPFNVVDLEHWAEIATSAVHAATLITYYFDQRASFLRQQRGEPPKALSDLVTGNITPEEREAWERILAEPVELNRR